MYDSCLEPRQSVWEPSSSVRLGSQKTSSGNSGGCMERVICYIVKPKKNLQEVRNCLDASGISYSYDTDIIFANLAKSFPALDEVADVKDPVFEENGKWYFVCEGDV